MSSATHGFPAAELLVSKIPSFTRALRQAIHDTYLERDGVEILYFIDADVAIDVIDGILALDSAPTFRPTQRLLVRSLISAQFIGRMYLTQPHAMELLSHVRTRDHSSGTGTRGEYGARLKRFVELAGLQSIMDELRTAIADSSGGDEMRQQLKSTLSGLAPEVFVALELASGTWQRRLKRCWEQGILTVYEDGAPGVRRDSSDRFFSALEENRPGSSMNNLHDAIALSSLRSAIRARGAGGSRREIRFYTETKAMRDVFSSSSATRASLSYPPPTREHDEPVWLRSIYRDEGYFTLRASNPAIAFAGAPADDTNGGASMSLESLAALNASVDRLQSLSGEALRRAIEELHVGGVPLRELLARWQSLSLLGNVLSRYPLNDNVVRMLNHATEVWGFIQDRNTVEIAKESVREIETALEAKVRGLSDWLREVRQVREALASLRRQFRGLTTPEPMRDLGLVRWGAVLSAEGRQRVSEWCERLLHLDERSFTPAAEEIIEQKRAFLTLTFEEQLSFCAVLWFLQQFDHLVSCVDSLPDELDPQSVSLQLMKVAALCRRGQEGDLERITKLVPQLEQATRSLPTYASAAAGLGLGYGAYYLAMRSVRVSRIIDGSVDLVGEARRHAENALRFGQRAVDGLAQGTLEWAFAINHCAFVTSVFDLTTPGQAHIGTLIDLYNTRSLWHYRFADTVAYHHFLNALRDWEKATRQNREAAVSGVIRPVQAELKVARKWLELATPSFGDVEIVQHLEEINSFGKIVAARAGLNKAAPRKRKA